MKLLRQLFTSLIFLVGCGSEKPTLSQLSPGPNRHESLTETQLQRLKAIQTALSEVDKFPFEKWVDDFKRDAHPDDEIRCYEEIVKAYIAFSNKQKLSLTQKGEAYGLLLVRSASTSEDVLQTQKLKELTREQVVDLLSGFQLDAKPITYTKK